MSMTFDEYQKRAFTTAINSGDPMRDLSHWTLGIVGEGGEVAEKVKKLIRDYDGILSAEAKVELAKELGDVLWYLAVLADFLGVSFDAVAQQNLDKLASRKQRGKLHGNGDNR